MPDIAEKQWTESDDKNVEQQPNGFPGGMPAYIDGVGRMLMGAIKRSWRRFNPYYLTTGTGDDYVVSPDQSPTKLNLYEVLNFRIDRANTTATPTLRFGRANPYTIVKIIGGAKVGLAIGDLVEGKDHAFWFDGVNFVLSNPSSASTSTTITAGTGLTGGGTLADDITIALNSASIASLALADTALQPAVYDPTGVEADAFKTNNFYGSKLTMTQEGDEDVLTLNPAAESTGTLIKINSVAFDTGPSAHSFYILKGLVIGDAPDFNTYMGMLIDGDWNIIFNHFFGRQMAGSFPRIAQWGDHAQGLSTYALIAANTDSETGARVALGHSWNTDKEQVTALPDNVELGSVDFFGTDGVDRNGIGASYEVRSDGAWTSTSHPTKIREKVTPPGATEPVTARSVASDGQTVHTITAPASGSRKRHSFRHVTAAQAAAGTSMMIDMSPGNTDFNNRFAAVEAWNDGADDIMLKLWSSKAGTAVVGAQIRGPGHVELKKALADPANGATSSGYDALYLDSFDNLVRKTDGDVVKTQADLWDTETANQTADADYSVSVTRNMNLRFNTATLTANRTATLPTTTTVKRGTIIKFVRTGGGAFNLSVGGLKNLAQNQWCEVIMTGGQWSLVSFGSL